LANSGPACPVPPKALRFPKAQRCKRSNEQGASPGMRCNGAAFPL